ncbi:spinster family MFS transporter [uncultured Sphingomonas sp.]|uniref:spinster family MFS transporter n=1 Tax=uncultured Sphingomonas sp. TaxID=158754 RepID=UPI0035CA015F
MATTWSGYRGLVLAMLLLVYSFNFLDRQILGILAPAIKLDLHLSNTQLGLLGGTAFALLYSTLGVPLALIADRTSRAWVITASLAVWSGFTALCGTATGFGQLFAFRLGVGVGEAGGVAPSHALIADYFPPDRRARALAIYALGIPIGLAAGTLLGAYLATHVDWRAAFIVVGLAGMAVAPIFCLIVKDPVRRVPGPVRSPIGAVFAILARKPSFWLLSLAASMSSMAGYGIAFWLPSVVKLAHHLDLAATSYFVGSLLLVGGTSGVFAGGVLADRLGRADRGAYARVPALAWLVSMPLLAAGLWVDSPVAAWLLLLLPNALSLLWLGPVTTAIQHLVPSPMRATASASFLLINNLIGLGLGSWVMGALADHLAPLLGDQALRYAAIAAVGLYAGAVVLAWLAIGPLRRDWVDEAATA